MYRISSSKFFGRVARVFAFLFVFQAMSIVCTGYASDAHAPKEDVHASKEHSTSGGHAKMSGHATKEGHESEAGGEHHGTPFSYYLAWIILIVIAVATVSAYRSLREHEDNADPGHTPDFKGFFRSAASFLIYTVFLLFLVEGFIGHYNENIGLAFVRFAIKMFLGVKLMFWGLAFMHDEHGDEHGAHH